MTDDRTIPALAPRPRPVRAAHALQAADRELQTVDERPQAVEVRKPEAKEPQARKPRKSAPTPVATRVQLAADVTEDLRGRARAAFKHAAFFEDVATFSEFVSNALEAEIRRIEVAHNDGAPFAASTSRLPSGRPPGR